MGTTTTVSFSSIARSRTRKMPLWVNIENVTTGLYVALSKVENGAQLCLEEEVPGKEEQLWDYEEARSSGIFRSKTGLVADMKGPSMVDQTSSSGGEERRADKLDPDPHPVPVPDPNPDPDPHPVPDSDPDSDLFSKRFENCGTN